MTKRHLLVCGLAGAILSLTAPAFAAHISAPIIVSTRTPIGQGEGYLNFSGPVPGLIEVNTGAPSGTEEFTGWVGNPTMDMGGNIRGFSDSPTDNHLTHGDRADFDFVVENRDVEFGGSVAPNHPDIGALTWEIAPTQRSAHINPHTGGIHPHVTDLPDCDGDLIGDELCLPDFAGDTFNIVDVFSLSVNQPADPENPFDIAIADTEAGLFATALDYELTFCNVFTGQCEAGIPVAIFTLGWNAATTADDYIARWVSPIAATHVLIDPPIDDHDGIVQIDAIVAFQRVPEPSTPALLGAGALGLLGCGRRRRMA